MLYFSLLNTFVRKGKDSEPDPYTWTQIRIQEAQKHADPADPDSQHWQEHKLILSTIEDWSLYIYMYGLASVFFLLSVAQKDTVVTCQGPFQ